MRALLAGGIGGVATIAAFAVSRTADGLLGAAAFMLALFLIPVTVGIVIALHHEGASRLRHRVRLPRRGRNVRGSGRICSTCRGRLDRRRDAWVCATCDQPAAGRIA